MAVTLDLYTPATRVGPGQTTYTVNVATSGTDRYLEAYCIVQNVSAQPTSVTMTYGGVSMTQEGVINVYPVAPSQWWLYRFYMVNPASGTNALTVTSSSAAYLTLWSTSLNGADQTSPIDATTSNSGTAGSPAIVSHTSSTDAWWSVCGANIDGPFTGGYGITSTLRDVGGTFAHANVSDTNGQVLPQTATVGLTYSGTRNWGVICSSIKPAGGGGTPTANANFFGGGI